MAFFNEFPHTRTYDSDLGWLIGAVKKNIEQLQNLLAWKDLTDKEIEEIQMNIGLLNKTLEDIENRRLPQLYLTAIENWMNQHFIDYAATLVKQIFFGLTLDGHIVAAIPYSWDFIQFDTIMDPTSDLFGHLVLRW